MACCCLFTVTGLPQSPCFLTVCGALWSGQSGQEQIILLHKLHFNATVGVLILFPPKRHDSRLYLTKLMLSVFLWTRRVPAPWRVNEALSRPADSLPSCALISQDSPGVTEKCVWLASLPRLCPGSIHPFQMCFQKLQVWVVFSYANKQGQQSTKVHPGTWLPHEFIGKWIPFYFVRVFVCIACVYVCSQTHTQWHCWF